MNGGFFFPFECIISYKILFVIAIFYGVKYEYVCLLSSIIFSHLVPLCLISILNLYCGLTLILKLNEENKDTSWGLEYNYEPGHNDSRGINENPTPTLKLK